MIKMLIYYIKKASNRNISFLLQKIFDLVKSKILHSFNGKLFRPYYISPNKRIKINIKHQFFFPHLSPNSFKKKIIQIGLDKEFQVLLTRAEQIKNHEFNFLGSQKMAISFPINWNKDYNTNYEWQYKYFTQYYYPEIICLDIDADVKIPWELARLQFLPQLALAYIYKQDKTYLNSLVAYLKDWIEHNPIGWGLGWRSTMETSLRAINLIWTVQLINKELKEIGLYEKLIRLLFQHGLFIYANMEYSDVNGNHHSSCLLGLFYLGLFFSEEHNEARNWLAFSKTKLEKEIFLETFEDGICFEGSIPYHRLVAEFFAHAGILAKINDLPFSDKYYQRLYKILEAPLYYTKPTGVCPTWGDNDDGQVLKLGGCHLNAHLYLSEIKNLLFDEPLEVYHTNDYLPHLNTFLLFPNLLAEKSKNVNKIDNKTQIISKAFSDAGFFILRNANNYLFIDCGDTGLKGRGSHGHNDLLNVELCLDGVDIFLDKGNWAYTRSKKQRINDLSAKSHNLPIIENIEYAPIITDSFIVAQNPKYFKVEAISPVSFTGYVSYTNAKGDKIKHLRKCHLIKNNSSCKIEDHITIDTNLVNTEANWNWLISPDLKLIYQENHFLLFESHEKRFSISFSKNIKSISIEEAIYSPTYGVQLKTNKILCKGILLNKDSLFYNIVKAE